ncbi:MAG: SBBP repeat-containing protein [candidate division NC10 bacterium]|nr:SBBP repeat-containing protein [candidate division NC10 bacterium]MDE2322039.1 SBBP repeat-containing protein [candidate division NC10 bacterium]
MDLIDRAKASVGLVMGFLALLNCQAAPAQASPSVSSGSFAAPNAATEASLLTTYGKLPMYFEANQGQTNPQVKFLARGHGYTIFLTDTKAILVLRQQSPQAGPTILRMELVGASPKRQVVGIEKLLGRINYLRGNDPTMWRADIPTYAKVRNQSVYPGIDLVYYGNQSQLEYDFLVAPGADPQAITLRFEGAKQLNIGTQGDLVIHTEGGFIRLQKPILYQELEGTRRAISGGYMIKDAHHVGFQVGAYDPGRPLVIDPVVAYSTLLGGSGDELGLAIAVDAKGHAYVTGRSESSDFPTSKGAFRSKHAGAADVFVTKLAPDGASLVYSTFLGGSGDDWGHGIAVDAEGHAYVTGETTSANFPTTREAFSRKHNGDRDAFVTKLASNGARLIYSTFLGGSSEDWGHGIAVDAEGHAYVTGGTRSANFPTTREAFSRKHNGDRDAFVTKLAPNGARLIYSTFLGGVQYDWGYGIAVDSEGHAYVTGETTSANFPTTPGAFDTKPYSDRDVFVTKLAPDGASLVYSTFLGGSRSDWGHGIAVDAKGHAYITGGTLSADFPTTPGARDTSFKGHGDAFVTKFAPDGASLVYSTFLGGTDYDVGFGIAVDDEGHAYVTGRTKSLDFPTTPGAVNTSYNGWGDAFVTKLAPTGSALVYSTYLGGSQHDWGEAIAVDKEGHAYVTGGTKSSDFPTTPGAFSSTLKGDGDAFITKYEF